MNDKIYNLTEYLNSKNIKFVFKKNSTSELCIFINDNGRLIINFVDKYISNVCVGSNEVEEELMEKIYESIE